MASRKPDLASGSLHSDEALPHSGKQMTLWSRISKVEAHLDQQESAPTLCEAWVVLDTPSFENP